MKAELDADQIADTISVAARLAFEVGPVELRAKGSQRLFLELSDAGREQGRLARHRQTAAGVEVGRSFVNGKGHYGRLAAEWVDFLPEGVPYAGLLFHTGILARPEQLWSLGLSIQVRFRLGGDESRLGLSAESDHRISEGSAGRFRLGGAVSWTQFLKGDGPGALPTEHALLTLGPSATWESPWGEWQARLAFRLWLDNDTPTTKTAYLSVFDLPALSVSWTGRL